MTSISPAKPIRILVAEDDPDDRLLIEQGIQEARCANAMEFVTDGVELMDYLHGRGNFEDRDGDMPDLILLDLNMPRKDGREAVSELKSDPNLRHIPVVILTTSVSDIDILKSYDLGANSYITKPVTFEKLVEIMKTVTSYWLQIVRLPVKI